MRYTVLLLFAAALAAQENIVSVGFKAGVPATNASSGFTGFITTTGVSTSNTGRWTLGPTVEVRIYHGLSIEVDALYRSYKSASAYLYTGQFLPDSSTVQFFSTYKSETHVWDVPALLKYRFTTGRWRPFIDAGYQWSFSSSDGASFLTCLSGSDACSGMPFQFGSFSSSGTNIARGPVVGVGLEFKVGKIKIAPEVRYAHPNHAPNVNQLTVLAGFTF
ncbi:MAG TPA: outer membrane beta-barrel protein [Bryobacteraceae bacterium]|nr:outer membrane beta-barrel protein [Bryobacteraceae bacterium]